MIFYAEKKFPDNACQKVYLGNTEIGRVIDKGQCTYLAFHRSCFVSTFSRAYSARIAIMRCELGLNVRGYSVDGSKIVRILAGYEGTPEQRQEIINDLEIKTEGGVAL